jgi:hypothetical protein
VAEQLKSRDNVSRRSASIASAGSAASSWSGGSAAAAKSVGSAASAASVGGVSALLLLAKSTGSVVHELASDLLHSLGTSPSCVVLFAKPGMLLGPAPWPHDVAFGAKLDANVRQLER